jgi:hypothetical protein
MHAIAKRTCAFAISLAARLVAKELGLSFRQQTGLIVGY